jgi:hypothetical protein
MDDLIERLQDTAQTACVSGCEGRCKACPAAVMREAADELAAARKLIEELQSSVLAHLRRAERVEAELAAFQKYVEKAAPRSTAANRATLAYFREESDRYRELLFAVCNKHPNETRHETVLRYIRQAEKQDAAIAPQSEGEDNG